ncbi:Cell division control protein 1 [Spathaspora sp. JA1]|nr:Cell division control protein 1 [Spathaspora sp. JA1]
MLFMPKFKSIHQLSFILLVVWTATFYYHERYNPTHTIRKCQWPTVQQQEPQQRILESRMLLVADPQLIDNHTYPGRNNLLLKLSQHTVDAYIKKNYRALVGELSPDFIVFLGDLLDNGRDSTDKYFYNQVDRFKKIFYNPYKSRYIQDINWYANLPGNHDIGFGNGVNEYARDRFVKQFGQSNTVITMHGVEFVILDTPSISADTSISTPATQFIQEIPGKNLPRVLFSHIPLFRDPSLSCGIHREAGPFDVFGLGYQYQNTVSEPITNQILTQIKPDLVISGDDHDYCDVNHVDGTREITVKSISLAMGKKYPAVQLLSFAQGTSGGAFNYNTEICYMPVPYINIYHYVLMAIISTFLILWWNLKQKSSRYTYSSSILPMNYSSIVNIPIESHSKKLKKFLKEQEKQDSDTTEQQPVKPTSSTYTLGQQHVFTIPNYTFTQKNNSSWVKYIKNSKLGQTYILNRRRAFTFMKRWNLFSFLKNSIMLGISVIGIYYFIYWI